jgi:hypothetical protein
VMVLLYLFNSIFFIFPTPALPEREGAESGMLF